MKTEPTRYWSHGPHYMYPDSIIFLTWRLAETLPKHIEVLFEQLKSNPDSTESKWAKHQLEQDIYHFAKFEEYNNELTKLKSLDFSLNDPQISEIIRTAFHFYDGKSYELHAYCIMHNHVHLIIKPLKDLSGEYHRFGKIVKSLKSYTAKNINKVLNRTGQLWDRYYFDKVIRGVEDYSRIAQYIRMNPVVAGLVSTPEDWRDTYVNESFFERL